MDDERRGMIYKFKNEAHNEALRALWKSTMLIDRRFGVKDKYINGAKHALENYESVLFEDLIINYDKTIGDKHGN